LSLRQVDLNLFRVFEAVLQHRSIIGASRELHLTPSAVSHALGRLRTVLSDKLFIASENGMEPTARALELAPHVRGGLQQIDAALNPRAFDPGTTRRAFRIAASDYGTATVLPHLAAQLEQLAPGVGLHVLPIGRRDTVRQLEDGRIDLAIGWFGELAGALSRRVVWTDNESIVARIGHPLGRGKPTREQLREYPQVVVEPGGGEPSGGEGFTDDRGVTRRVRAGRALREAGDVGAGHPHAGRAAVCVPHYASVIPVVQASDMLATLPASLARPAAERGELLMLELPYQPQTASLEAVWHQRSDTDAGLSWLIETMLDTMHAQQEPLQHRA